MDEIPTEVSLVFGALASAVDSVGIKTPALLSQVNFEDGVSATNCEFSNSEICSRVGDN